MLLIRRSGWAAVLCVSLSLAGCGKNEADAVARTRAKLVGKDSRTAQIELKSLIQAHPKSGEARFLWGSRLAADGDAAAAVIEFERALELGYQQGIVLPALVDAMTAAGQGQRAVLTYGNTKLPDAEADSQLQAALANALAASGDLQGAQGAVAKALASNASSVPALLMKARLAAHAKDLPAALAIVDQLLAHHPDHAEAWKLKGDLLLRTADGRKQAIEALTKSLQLNPNQTQPQATLISMHLAQGNLDAARRQLASLKKLAPRQLDTGFLEGQLAYVSGDHARAREVFQSLLQAMPDNLVVLIAAGENDLKLNATVAAEAQFAKAVALAPTNVTARRLLAQAQIKLGQSAKALATLAPLVDTANASAEALALAAQVRLLNGAVKAADALYARLAKLKPTDPKLRTAIASSGFGKGSDDAVFAELRAIAAEDASGSTDIALISALLTRNQSDAALLAQDRLARKRPDDPMLNQLRGLILTAKGDLAGARQSLEAELGKNKAYFPALSALVALDLKEGRPEVAQQRIKDLLKAQPKNAQAMLALAKLLQAQGAPAIEVLEQIDAAVKAEPADLDARVALISHHFASGDFDAALNAALAATVALPSSIELLELQARCYMQLSQSQQALSSYGKVVTLHPNSPRGHVGAADVHLHNNDLEQAQRAIDRALELAPALPEAQTQAVTVALRRKQHDKALAIARSLQAARPDDSTGMLLEGEVEFNRANWSAAAAAFKKALDKPASDSAAPKLHATLMRAGKPADAESFAAQWLKAHPRDIRFLYYLGDAAHVGGDLAAARSRYERVLTLRPDHALALNNLAMLLMHTKQPGALALAERATKAAPNQAAMLDTLAQAQAGENRLKAAIETQNRAVKLAPAAHHLRLGLARILLQAGEKAKAKVELERLASLGSAFKHQDEVSLLLKSITRG